ncbi:alpha/beta fold hydrolase [Solimonas marina]|uniref:Alpha/beta hydrolase n=1 Tax=Solimonas marina TaxID=2714601 RepID=A0A969W9X3_9GAMM|nr:alpha/beta hydrolase [Solimonas marina]NKF22249.1 alpha/beta hydrolase [Solimonas marina]
MERHTLTSDLDPAKAGSGLNAVPALLMLPGMLCNEQSWLAQQQALAPLLHSEVVRYPLSRCRSLTDMAAHVLEAAPSSFLLAGHSMGGRVALEILRLAPERVAGLCLIGTEHLPNPGGERGQQETAGRLALLETARRAGMRAMAEAWLPNLLPEARRQDASLVEAITQMMADHSAEQLQAYIEAGASRPDSTTLLSAITVPTLLIGGKQDRIRPLAILEDLHRLVSGSTLLAIDGCGHMPMMEYPEPVNAAMREWVLRCLADNPSDPPAASGRPIRNASSTLSS